MSLIDSSKKIFFYYILNRQRFFWNIFDYHIDKGSEPNIRRKKSSIIYSNEFSIMWRNILISWIFLTKKKPLESLMKRIQKSIDSFRTISRSPFSLQSFFPCFFFIHTSFSQGAFTGIFTIDKTKNESILFYYSFLFYFCMQVYHLIIIDMINSSMTILNQ